MTPRGKFITLEGIEGVGKSTHCAFIAATLRELGHSVVTTREPGGTALGEAIRDLLLDNSRPTMAALSELLLIFAARAEHLARVIEPALRAGEWVLSDRFTDATYAYQGGGRALAVSSIQALEALVQQNLQPDLTLLLDAPVTLALGRARARAQADRFESERAEFFERVRRAYLDLAQAQPGRFRIIDAAPAMEQVQLCIRQVLAREFT